MMKGFFGVAAVAALLFPTFVNGQVAVPKELEGWQAWALDGQEFRRCPFLSNSDPNSADSRICAWPARLSLDLTASGGRFSQSWQVFSDAWVALPGSLEHWPRGVTINGKAGAVVAHDGLPQIRFSAGVYVVAGSFAWETRPESLPIPAQSGLISLTLDGRAVPQADRPDGAVWLGKRRGAEQIQGIEVQVYRLLTDELPALLTTRLRLQVAGDAREELLSTVLPQGFTPMTLLSALPARIDADGRLRVQARAGSWEITLTARGADSAQKISVPSANGLWPKQEVWSYAANDRLRVAAVEGAEGIDPAQANVPQDWRQLPSYRVWPGGSLQIVERSRGLSVQDGNRLKLRRQIYLDFDHGGFTVADQIAGQLRTNWRLDMEQPYRLESATKDGQNLLVTTGARPSMSGLELRSPQLSLSTLARLDARSGRVPATGWAERFEQVSGVLNLPPGHRLLVALGVDSAPGAWIERWGLLDVFLLLITAVIALRLCGLAFAFATLFAIALVHQENPLIVWLLLLALIALVALGVAPQGWLRHSLSWARNILFGALLLVLVPFTVSQVRYALYPQLADEGSPYSSAMESRLQPQLQQVAGTGARRDANAPAPVELAEIALDKAEALAGSTTPIPSPHYSGLNMRQNLQRYAPGTLVQAGPGRPRWSYVTYDYSWNGPVEVRETVRFVILTPWMVALWRILGVAIMVGIFTMLARRGGGWRAEWQRFVSWRSSALAVATALLLMSGGVRQAQAASIPDRELLNELRTRLTRPPECLPSCVEVLAARVALLPDSLEAQLEVSALSTVALALPAAPNRFEPESVSIDGTTVAGVYRDRNHQYWITLNPGVHQVHIAGRLPPAEAIQVVFPQVPRSIAVSGSGWDITGVNEGRLLANTLELVRRRVAGGSADGSESSAQFPPFVRVRRQFQIDLDWSISTTIERLAPATGGFTLQLPLLPSESVLTAGIETRNGETVLIGFNSTEQSVGWRSGLARANSLTLTAPKDAAWIEVWSFSVSPMWRVAFSGLPAVMPQNLDPANWSFEYFPRPGETLTLTLSRPPAVKGASLAIDDAVLSSNVGKRATESALSLTYRSTQGGRQAIRLPLDANVTEVSVDGASVPVRPENGELPLVVLPGSHRVQINWRSDVGAAVRTRAPAVDLRSPSSNVSAVLRLPADRWVLYAGGRGVGPAILYWGELLLFVIVAALVARTGRTPLKMHEWLLLGLGLSTFSWAVLLLFATWLFAMRWRESFDAAKMHTSQFNAMQVVLIVLSVVAVLSLVTAIPNGLLATPDMRVVGAGQSAGQLTWFNDLSAGPLPAPWVLSVSLWWYKLAILLWALWLAFALVRWVPPAWRALNAGGFWRKNLPRPSSP